MDAQTKMYETGEVFRTEEYARWFYEVRSAISARNDLKAKLEEIAELVEVATANVVRLNSMTIEEMLAQYATLVPDND